MLGFYVFIMIQERFPYIKKAELLTWNNTRRDYWVAQLLAECLPDVQVYLVILAR